MSTVDVDPRLLVAVPGGRRDIPARLDLVEALPGLPGHITYGLEPLDGIGVLFAMRSTGTHADQVRLFVIAPQLFFPAYDPAIPRSELADELAGVDDVDRVLLTVVRPSEQDGVPPTANLLAPIVVDARTGLAQQVVLDEDLPLRAPVG